MSGLFTMSGVVELSNALGEVHWQFAARMFWQVGLLISLLLLIDVSLLRRMKASLRYAVWTLVLVKLMLPVTLSTPLSIGQLMPARVTNRAIDKQPTSDSQLGLEASQELASLPPAVTHIQDFDFGLAASDEPKPPAESIVEVFSVDDSDNGEKTSGLSLRGFIFLIWLVITSVLLAQFFRRSWLIRRLIARSVAAGACEQNLLDNCASLLRLSASRIRLRLSSELRSPAICGFVSPTILVPRELVGRLDDSQWKQIFIHELAHWRRLDLHVNVLQSLLQVFYFYNPLVWLANSILRQSREQAVDETVLSILRAEPQDYSSTLISVAETSRQSMPRELHMVGAIGSRHSLGKRIKRILARPIPKRAAAGLTGLVIVAVTAFVLLPMARFSSPLHAQDAAAPEANTEEVATGSYSLWGRLVDDLGDPVTDAELELIPVDDELVKRPKRAKSDEDGNYHFPEVDAVAKFRLAIRSKRCSGKEWRDELEVLLTPKAALEKNLTLPRACRVLFYVVDENGDPIEKVRAVGNRLTAPRFHAGDSSSTDETGWATVGGLKPSEDKYIFALWHSEFAMEKVIVKLDDPAKEVVREVVLRKGKVVKGEAICSDGKPPAGWTVRALPSWWHFGRYPIGVEIDEDGSFTLPHIGPGEYDVAISVDLGNGMSSPKPVLDKANLSETVGNLKLKMDYPSPASLTYITGKVKLTGPSRGFRIEANAIDGQAFSSSKYVSPREISGGTATFKLGPLEKATYKIVAEGGGIESDTVTVRAPAEDITLSVSSIGKPTLSGKILAADTGKPVTSFGIRVFKVRTLSGPNYAENRSWRTFDSKDGSFETQANGPGIFRVLISAPGFAPTYSKDIKATAQDSEPFEVSLSPGVTLAGKIQDANGNPVDGAQVVPLALYAQRREEELEPSYKPEDRVTKTVDGAFEIANLVAEKQTFRVTHPSFSQRDIEITPSGSEKLVSIVLSDGGVVTGRVFDWEGDPVSNLQLSFIDEHRVTRAKIVTDEDGYYRAEKLPPGLYHVHRADQWEAMGIGRQSIVVREGQNELLDFGGKTELTGRLLVNGKPHADSVVCLADGVSHSDSFRALARTSSDGSFSFLGLPPGRRTLFYRVPGRRRDMALAREVVVLNSDQDLGKIDQIASTIEVHIDGPKSDRDSVSLYKFDPVWPVGNSVGIETRDSPDGPVVITNVPPGDYELSCQQHPGLKTTLQRVKVTSSEPQVVRVQIPSGNATLAGTADDSFNIRSLDGKFWQYVNPPQSGSFKQGDLPAGEYVICYDQIRNADVVSRIKLSPGETTKVSLPKRKPSSLGKQGYLNVRVLASNGQPIPCEIQLHGSGGQVSPHAKHSDGQVSFVAPSEDHTLVVRHPSFREVQKQVRPVPLNDETRASKSFEVEVELTR